MDVQLCVRAVRDTVERARRRRADDYRAYGARFGLATARSTRTLGRIVVTKLDALALVWLIGGTFAIKMLLRATQINRVPKIVYLMATVIASTAPAIAMKLAIAPYSAAGVVVAGIAFFWFAILAERLDYAA